MARRAARRWIPITLGIAVLASTALGVMVAVDPEAAAARARTGIETVVPAVKPVPAAVTVSPASGAALDPSAPITVRATGGVLRDVHVTDAATGKAVDGRMDPDRRSWTSTGQLGYATTYAVAVDSAGDDGTPGHQTESVHTVSPAAQAYPSLIPPPSTSSVGVGQPIVVRFDHPVHDRAAAERHLHVTATPAQQGSWYWISDSEVHYRPRTYWTANSTVTVKTDLYGVDLGKGVYGAADRSETVHVHDAWVAKADGRTEKMQLFDNGRLVKTMNISLGSPGFPSHTGPHVISDKQPTITMDSCTYGVCQGQPGYYREKVDLDERISNDGEFVHSAPWSVGQQGSSNVSHGCVNLAPADAQWFFDHFGIGDVVEVTNSGGQPLPVYDTYGDWELNWQQWQQGSAL